MRKTEALQNEISLPEEEYSPCGEAITPPAKAVAPPSEEYAQSREFVPSAPEFFTAGDFVCEKKSSGKKDSELRKLLLAVLCASALIATVSLTVTDPAVKEDVTEVATAVVEQTVTEVVGDLPVVSDIVSTAVVATPSPSPEPYAGISDAELLLKQKTWYGNGICVTFLPGGGGYWISGSDNGIMTWGENEDGSVHYSGSAVLFNYSSSDSSGEMSYTPYTDGEPIYYAETVTCSGTVGLNRSSVTISMDNPLANPCTSYSGDAGLIGAVEPDPVVTESLDTWAVTDTETILTSGAFTSTDVEGSVEAFALTSAGSGTLTVLGQNIPVSIVENPDIPGTYVLQGTDGDITVTKSDGTVSVKALNAIPVFRDGNPHLLVLDMFGDAIPVYRILDRTP